MVKRYCDICGNETNDWQSGYVVEGDEVPVIVVGGMIKARRRLVFETNNSSHEEDIDICVDCYIKILSGKRFQKIYASL